MRDELDSEGQWQRLVDLYRAMPDEELLGLAERPGDLTEMAQGVLRSEMASRRLQVEAAEGFGVEAGRLAGLGPILVRSFIRVRSASRRCGRSLWRRGWRRGRWC